MNMSNIFIVKMDQNGTVLIPEEVREQMHLESGSEFVIIKNQDSITLKQVIPTSKKVEIDELLAFYGTLAKKHKLKRHSITETIKEARAEEKARKQ